MAVDTVKLRSPTIDEGTAVALERMCILRQGILLSTGEIMYEITTGNLEGSYDSRIMFRVMREDWVMSNGKLMQVACKPFLLVECSWHKFFYGQNVFGNPVDFHILADMFVNFLGEIMTGDYEVFSEAVNWEVRRVDWAEMFILSKAAQREYFRSFRDVHYPRRQKKEARYATAIHFPGSFTTFRAYSKGPEFLEHGASVVRRALTALKLAKARVANAGKGGVVLSTDDSKWINRKVCALQRLADNRLRVEVQINADKLRYDFGGRFPRVSEITDDYLIKVYDDQVFKLFKEGRAEMETVRTYDRVKARLNFVYGKQCANALLAFWMQFSARGEDAVRAEYSRSTFYYNRKKLIDAGVSWNSTDVFIIPQDTALPRDFVPLSTNGRRCIGGVSSHSIFSFCPVEQYRLLHAA
jgi:II/X family phage/plasmid replication protein